MTASITLNQQAAARESAGEMGRLQRALTLSQKGLDEMQASKDAAAARSRR